MDGFGIKRFHGAKVLKFNLPEQYRNGYETLEYSFRLMTGMHPKDYKRALSNVNSAMMIITGLEDEELSAVGFESGVTPYKSDVEIHNLEGVNHLGILVEKASMNIATEWLKTL